MTNRLANLALVTTYLENKDEALKLMRTLVASKFAACVNIFESYSCFERQGHVNEITEWKLVAKTSLNKAQSVFDYIKSMHPNEIPYIVMQKAQANIEYIDWLNLSIA